LELARGRIDDLELLLDADGERLAHWGTLGVARSFEESQVRWPLDGPCETRSLEGVGRPGPATGCSARRQRSPERLTMSDRQDLPTGETLTRNGGSPCRSSAGSTGRKRDTPSA